VFIEKVAMKATGVSEGMVKKWVYKEVNNEELRQNRFLNQNKLNRLDL
jgi:hypothetical protein